MAEFICPHCGNTIDDEEALLCLYCGSSLRRKIGFMGKMKHSPPVLVLTFVVILVIFCFIMLFIR